MAQLYANGARSVLVSSITASSTALQIDPAHEGLFPVAAGADWFKVAVEDSSGNIEYIRVQRATGQSVLTVTTRAVEDSAKFPARSFSAGAVVQLRMTAADLVAALAHPSAGVDAHDASAISFTPSGTLAADDVQEAIQELDSEKLAVSATTAFTRSLLDDADAAAARATLDAASRGANTFTGPQTLPGNAVNPLEAVPLQQLGDRARFSLYAEVATASVLRAAFTSIPIWAKKLTLNINGVGSTGSTLARLRVRIGSGGAMQTSGYAGCSLVTRNAGATSGANLATAGIEFVAMTGSAIRCGSLVLTKVGGNVWAFNGCIADSTSTNICTVAGVHTTLAGALDTLDVVMGDGSSEQFNAGSVSLLVEG